MDFARASSVLGLVQAVRSGVGVGPLPASIADTDPRLVQVIGPIAALERSWRLLTTPKLRRTARISSFFDFIARERAAVRAALS